MDSDSGRIDLIEGMARMTRPVLIQTKETSKYKPLILEINESLTDFGLREMVDEVSKILAEPQGGKGGGEENDD